MDTNVSQIRYTFEITGDEAELLRMLLESLASKEGLVVEHSTLTKLGEFNMQLGPSADHSNVLIECTRASDKQYNLRVQRLRDESEAHHHMMTFAEFMVDWYTELRKALFR